MKFNILLIVLLASLLVVFMGGCTENADMSLDTTFHGLDVVGEITTDTTTHRVILSKSGDVLNRTPIEYVSNAVVTISDGSLVFPLTENPDKKGVYETAPNVYGQAGKTYTLSISNVDINGDGTLETYSATSELKKINPIDSFKFVRENADTYMNGWSLNMFSQDIGGGRNYYLIRVRVNGKMVTDSINEYGTGLNAGFEGKYYYGASVYFLSYNKVDERLTPMKDTVTLELAGITKEYYDFIEAYKIEYNPKNPIFSGPSANPGTNIVPKENACGFFAAYSIQRKSRVYK